MKKILLFLPLLAITMMSFAGNVPNDPLTEQAFKKQFAGAEAISWTRIDNEFMKVSFIWNGHRTQAFFNSNAELVGSARAIFYEQLPMSVMRGIEKEFPKATTLEIAEIYMQESTSYNIILEKGDKKYKVRFSSLGQVIEKEKIKK